jgi:hypothetical protein
VTLVDVELLAHAVVAVTTPAEAQAFREALQARLDAAVELIEEHAVEWDKSKAVWLATVRAEEEVTE